MPARIIRGTWYVDFRWEGVRHRKKSPINNRRATEQYELQLRQRMLDVGTTAPQHNTLPTLTEFSERWLIEHVAVKNRAVALRSRRSHLRMHILPFFGRYRLDTIMTRDVDGFIGHLVSRGLAPKTVNNVVCTLRSCLRKAQSWELLKKTPAFELMKLPPPSNRFLSMEEAQRLVAAAPEGLWRTMILVAVTTGLRVGELLALEWTDLDLERALLTVARTEVHGSVTPPKSGALRSVPLCLETLEALRSLPKTAARVFPIPVVSAYGYVRRRLVEIGEIAGVQVNWHLLRHTFASQLVSNGAALTAVQDCLGHSTVQMTHRYAHLAPTALRDAVRLLPTFTSGATQQSKTHASVSELESLPVHPMPLS